MRVTRFVFASALVLTLVPLQFAVVNRLPLPGAGPDLLVVAVAAVGLAAGPSSGLLFGFCAGLAADAAPPADHTLGRLALAYALAGYVAGLLADEAVRSAFAPMVVVGLAAIIAEGTFIVVGALLGDARITVAALIHDVPSAVLYDVVLAPFIVPVVGAVYRRVEVDPSRRVDPTRR
jgi:rod shape-determining protein MreD